MATPITLWKRSSYLLDRELGFNLVPLTVQRLYEGNIASVQLRVLDLEKSSDTLPDEIKLFDFLINNRDRHSGNWLKTLGGRNIAIDHDSETFNKYSIPLTERLYQKKLKLTPFNQNLVKKDGLITIAILMNYLKILILYVFYILMTLYI